MRLNRQLTKNAFVDCLSWLLDMASGLLRLDGEANTVLGFALGETIWKAGGFEATFFVSSLILNVAPGLKWNDVENEGEKNLK